MRPKPSPTSKKEKNNNNNFGNTKFSTRFPFKSEIFWNGYVEMVIMQIISMHKVMRLWTKVIKAQCGKLSLLGKTWDQWMYSSYSDASLPNDHRHARVKALHLRMPIYKLHRHAPSKVIELCLIANRSPNSILPFLSHP